MKNISEIRHENFIKLRENYKSDRDFSKQIGISHTFTSNIKNKVKNIGEKIARQIEEYLVLPYGWMDQDHDKDDSETSVDEMSMVHY